MKFFGTHCVRCTNFFKSRVPFLAVPKVLKKKLLLSLIIWYIVCTSWFGTPRRTVYQLFLFWAPNVRCTNFFSWRPNTRDIWQGGREARRQATRWQDRESFQLTEGSSGQRERRIVTVGSNGKTKLWFLTRDVMECTYGFLWRIVRVSAPHKNHGETHYQNVPIHQLAV